MHRIRLCATIVALLSVISFSGNALILGSAADHDGITTTAAAAPQTALAPDGKPVRVISLSPSDRPSDVAAAPVQPQLPLAATPQPEPPATKPIMAEGAPAAGAPAPRMQAAEAGAEPVAHPAAPARHAPKRIAAAPARMRAASAGPQPFIVSGLF